MSHTSVLPGSLAVGDLLEDLLGREVTVGSGSPMTRADLPTAVLAVFTDTAERLYAVVGMQLEVAAGIGAARGLLPPRTAEESIERRALTPDLAEEVFALCNALTGLFNVGGAPHVKLYQVVYPTMPIPEEAVAYMIALGERADLSVEVAPYGKGKFSISLAQ
jgi:hypothetical protein